MNHFRQTVSNICDRNFNLPMIEFNLNNVRFHQDLKVTEVSRGMRQKGNS